ncbi:MAG: tRNA pseudouridine(55) synthase TruB [Acidobacteria bacterium]|nr:MAG: tRNA pseudouridine(55) synthase TruB [Acidobacteriota bacterium]
MNRSEPPIGMILVDKPAGMTSHDVVQWVRRLLGTRRVGHAGTLDPLATGLLPCLVGPATRLVRFLHGWDKCYVGVIALGEETESGDAEGAEGVRRARVPPAPVLRAAVSRLTGTILQTPPAFSAKKIGGQPAHRLARRGYRPALPPVRVTVHRLRLHPRPDGRLLFAARVSSGTYLRALARDLGRLLGTGAHLERLRRTGIGPLRVREAVRPGAEEAARGRLLPPEAIPLPFPTLPLGAAELGRFRSGQPVPARAIPGRAGWVRVLDPEGRLVGVGEWDGGGAIRPRVVIRP